MARKPAPFPKLSRMLIALVAALLPILAAPAHAHDIPIDITVQMFVKPDARDLHLLVRVPLRAMRDIEYPVHGAGFLDLAKVDPALREAATVWLSSSIEVYEGSSRLPSPRLVASRVSLESDRSFDSYTDALAHITGPALPADTQVIWDQSMMDVLFDYPIQSDRSKFSVHPGVGDLAVHVAVVLRFLPPGGAVRAFEFLGDPGLVRLDPSWRQAALRFVQLGFLHILDGTDHLLFLFCLVIPFRRFRALIPVITAFTVAHSITLIASAYNIAPDALWFPPLIETLIAVSIVYMALENIVGGVSVHRRWMIAFCFGLVHGFGFSFILRQTLQFAGSHLLASLLSFNIGVELGQLLVLALLIPALELLFRFAVPERMGTIILSAIVAHTAWHWMIDRGEILSRFQFTVPGFNAASWTTAIHAAMIVLAVAGAIWLTASFLRHRAKSATTIKPAPRPQA
jgi:HupE / UreJ protein